jgi:hypothetical protein
VAFDNRLVLFSCRSDKGMSEERIELPQRTLDPLIRKLWRGSVRISVCEAFSCLPSGEDDDACEPPRRRGGTTRSARAPSSRIEGPDRLEYRGARVMGLAEPGQVAGVIAIPPLRSSSGTRSPRSAVDGATVPLVTAEAMRPRLPSARGTGRRTAYRSCRSSPRGTRTRTRRPRPAAPSGRGRPSRGRSTSRDR